ncbi:MAG: hypothetical protein JXJ04_14035 [Spirochaetales bacterium]|nr:hypothetical protein [Spirochaetales bacterium]
MNTSHSTHFFIILLLLLPVCLFSGETLNKEQITENLNQADSLFREAIEISKTDPWKAKELFMKSAIHFERIARDGKIRNGKLFYNTGNAFFRTGDIGKAILYYKRAYQLIPHDANLIKNLDYARSKRIDKIEDKEQTRIFRTIFFWHYETSPEFRFTIFIIFFFILWVFAILLLFIKKPFLKWGIIIPGIISALFFGSLFINVIDASTNNPGVILSSEVTARKGDSEAYEPSFQEPLHAGTEFNLIEKRRDWYNIELSDGIHCWIPEKSAELVRME